MFSLRYHQEKKEFEQNVGEHFSYQTSKLTSAIVYGLRVMIFHLAVAMNDESGGVGGGGLHTHPGISSIRCANEPHDTT